MIDTTDGQPKKTTRDCRLPETRVTQSELEAVKSRARDAGLSTSEFQRRACLSGQVVVRDASVNVEAVRQLLAIGRNLNQITKSGHIQGHVSEAALRKTLEKINDAVDGLLS